MELTNKETIFKNGVFLWETISSRYISEIKIIADGINATNCPSNKIELKKSMLLLASVLIMKQVFNTLNAKVSKALARKHCKILTEAEKTKKGVENEQVMDSVHDFMMICTDNKIHNIDCFITQDNNDYFITQDNKL